MSWLAVLLIMLGAVVIAILGLALFAVLTTPRFEVDVNERDFPRNKGDA